MRYLAIVLDIMLLVTRMETSVRVLIVISLHFMQKPIHKHKLLKSQIPSTKLQINLKLQYPMTKTDELAKRQKPFFVSFQRKPEFSFFEHLQRIWTPVFSGVTTSYETVKT
jgi:hypothetical protein